MPLSNQGEFALIKSWEQVMDQPNHPKVLLGIGDDAACLDDLKTPVFSCDVLIEDIHFCRDWMTARQLGWKAMAVNVSDMAAMGASPVAVTVSLALPLHLESSWVEELYRGFSDAAKQYGFSIVGGDTSKSAQLMLSVSIIGEPIHKRPLRRGGAKIGDALIVTGSLGDSAAGLAFLQTQNGKDQTDFARHCIERHFLPQARVAEVEAALGLGEKIHAAIDLSDGIAGDAGHIAHASRLDISIDTSKIPISEQCRHVAQSLKVDALQWALAGGEDYELLLCVDAQAVDEVVSLIQNKTRTSAQCVGVCEAMQNHSPQVRLHHQGSRVPLPAGWEHF